MRHQSSTAKIAAGDRGLKLNFEAGPEVRLINLHTRQNLGDAAIAQAATQLVGDQWPAARLTAASRYSTDSDWLRSLGTEPVQTAISFPGPGRSPAAARALTFVLSAALYRLGRKPGAAPDVALSNGGGYLFSRRQPELSLRHVLLEIEAMASRCPTILLPQTVGPLTRDRDVRAVRQALRQVRHLFVRDGASLAVALEQLELNPERVSFAPDLVFALARGPEARPASAAEPRIAMTVLDWRWAGGSDKHYAAYLEAMATAAQQLIDRGCRLDLCVQVDMRGKRGHDDMAVAMLVRERMRKPGAVDVVSAGATPDQAIDHYSAYNLVIGSRLHSALMGLCGGTPAIAIAYQPKASWIYEDLGLADWALEARGLDAAALLQRANEIVGDPRGSAQRVEQATTGMREKLLAGLSAVLEPWLGPPARQDLR